MSIFKERYYKLEKRVVSVVVDKHPLQSDYKYGKTSVTSKSSTLKSHNRKDFVDPLSCPNPLLSTSFETVSNSSEQSKTSKQVLNIEPWNSKRLNILTTYTTSEKLSIISSFLTTKPNEEVRVLNRGGSSPSVLDKMRSKFDQFDQFDEEIRETSNLSVVQFTEKINELNSSLKLSWQDGQRVRTLQIIIQSTKLLSEPNVIQFFPSKFVLITDLVDNFANLVYDRLKSKSVYVQRGSKVPIQLPENFRETNVPEVAKETARNWFYKVASIRELVARLYVEAALLPCYKFFDSTSIPTALIRLMKMARGIGNPLLSTYARAYVARVGIMLYPYRKDYLQLAFDDILESLSRMTKVSPDLNYHHSSADAHHQMPYLRLFVPAVDWILQCLCATATESELDAIVSRIDKQQNPLLVHSVLNSIDTGYIEKRPLYFAEMINALPDSNYPKYTLYKQLGACVSLRFSLGQDVAMELMKYVWKYISKLSECRHFIECMDTWAEFLSMNFDISHISKFLGHVAKEVTRDNEHHEFCSQLQSILSKIISFNSNYEGLFSSMEFIQYLALFEKEPFIIDVRQMVLDNFFNSPSSELISDPVMIQACIRILKEMNDSLNSLSTSDNRRTVCRLALLLLTRIRFDIRNVENELELLTQFRSIFGGMELVIYAVIERVNCLANRVRSLRPNNEHNSSSLSFVKACMAFNFITVASIDDSVTAVRLYTLTSQVALVNSCLGQTVASLKEAISLLSKLDNDYKFNDRSIDAGTVAELASNIASTLLMCPDVGLVVQSADELSQNNAQMLYLLKGLINAIDTCGVLKTDHVATQKSFIKGELYIKILHLLAAFSQADYIYHAGRTDANDKLYGGSELFLSTILDIFKIVVSKIRALNSDKVNQKLRESLMALLKLTSVENQNSVSNDWLMEIVVAS